MNFGQAAAMIAGYHFATGDYVVHVDDDGQSPVNNLWKLALNSIQEKNQSSRALSFINKAQPHFRLFAI